MSVTTEEQLAFFRAHPPSSLAGLGCAPADLPDYPFDGHGEPVNSVFSISCRCSGIFFTVHGHADEDGGGGPPITLTCDECQSRWVVFDPRKDGHDGVHHPGLPLPAGAPVELSMSDIEGPYEIYLRFEYPSDTLIGDASGWLPSRAPDLYSWITLVGLAEGQLDTLFDQECA